MTVFFLNRIAKAFPWKRCKNHPSIFQQIETRVRSTSSVNFFDWAYDAGARVPNERNFEHDAFTSKLATLGKLDAGSIGGLRRESCCPRLLRKDKVYCNPQFGRQERYVTIPVVAENRTAPVAAKKNNPASVNHNVCGLILKMKARASLYLPGPRLMAGSGWGGRIHKSGAIDDYME